MSAATMCGPLRKCWFCGDYPCTGWNCCCSLFGCWIFNGCIGKCCFTTQEELMRKEQAKQHKVTRKVMTDNQETK